MSIATDVSRIKGNITAALAAIADKGVTVPDGSTSDALASLIESIQAGSGGFENIQAVTGSFTPESLIETKPQSMPSNNAFTVEHNAGFVPRAAIAYTGTYGTSKLTLYAAIVDGLYEDTQYTISTYSVHQYYSNKKYINANIIKANKDTWSDSVFTIAHNNNKIQLVSSCARNPCK